ncbi:rab proteins geranylgeranyltransferase component A 2-like [Littorina saxatilis]|uniref:Rab proteins geranylgeranyltransferase component A n=1 Tax=Littorina saxatilis TaxID=31220 RepID=A0AAN9G7E3_9CAEN
MASDLPDEFDVIVLGTGLPETLLAAAFSRIGLTVLHLDRNDYYSGSWASFSLRQIPGWIEGQKKAQCYASEVNEEKLSSLLKEGERALQLPETFHTVFEAQSKYHVGERPKEEKAIPDSSPSTDESAKPDSTDTSLPPATASESGDSKIPELSGPSPTGDAETSTGIVPGQFDSAPEEEEDSKTEKREGEATGPAGEASGGKVEPAAGEQKQQREWFFEDIEKEWRKFSFDLTPKLLYCAGSMVELLIVSDVAKYCEFRTVSRVLTLRDNNLERVPCSRADVFSSKALSLLEKRLLMKFLTFAAEYDKQPDEYKGFEDKPFVEFLASKKLSPKIQYFILHAIAMATESTSTKEGLENTQKFLRSLGRYGNTAFLFPLYGSGELPQGFCRLSAVFGGIYVLTLSVSHLLVNDENKCTGVITSAGQRISCKYLIADPSYLPKDFYKVPQESRISRGIFVTDSSILSGEGEDLSLLQLPHEGQPQSPSTTVLELPPSAMVSPRHLYVVHMTRRAVSDISSDLEPAVSALFDATTPDAAESDKVKDTRKPRVLWSLHFQHRDLSAVSRSEQLPSNVFVVTGPGVELDTDRCVEEAKTIFKEICPKEEFLPKPPHPDDIIYVDTEEVPAAANDKGEWAKDANTAESSEIGDNAGGQTVEKLEDGVKKDGGEEEKDGREQGGEGVKTEADGGDLKSIEEQSKEEKKKSHGADCQAES